MKYRISHPTKKLFGEITLASSKSESNRALIIQALCSDKFEIENLSTSQDTHSLKYVLGLVKSGKPYSHTFDVGGAGTTMRFLTAYLSTYPSSFILTGNERMKARPLGILVDALRQLGADIEYLGQEGFAPIRINIKQLRGGEVEIDGSVSSQFISALLLIAPQLQNGLVIKFNGEVTSKPYIEMTLKMMQEFRVYGTWQENRISVSPQKYYIKSDEGYAYKVEADWSSASYWYSLCALSEECDFTIKGLKHPSLQGDGIVADIFAMLGLNSEYTDEGIRITKSKGHTEHLGFDFSDCPDLVQTIAVVVSAKNISALFTGLQTLKIKETDRIIALQNELAKLGATVEVDKNHTMKITPPSKILQPEFIATYDDHRMAMAFAPLTMMLESITIEEPEVVKKSYTNFWNDLKSLGFKLEELGTRTKS